MGIAPDKPRPDVAYVGTVGESGVKNVQNETQAKITAAQRAPLDAAYGSARSNMTNNLLGGFGNGIGGLVGMLAQGVFGVIGNIGDLIGGLLGIKNQASNANTAASAAQTAAAAASASAAANNIKVQQVRSELIQLADNIPAVDSWVSMVPGQQVSFPIFGLTDNVKSVSSTTSSESGSTSHSHSLQFLKTIPDYTPAANVVEGVWIQSKYSAGRATVSFFIGSGLSSRPPLYVYIGRMTEDGVLVIEWVSPDQTPIISNALQLVNVTMPEDLLFGFGEWMFVGIHQVGTGSRRALYCNSQPNLPLDPDAFPRQQKVHFTSTSPLTVGATLPKTSQLYSSPFVPWVGIGVRLRKGDPQPREWFDPFDESMSSRWTSVLSVGGLYRLTASGGRAGFSGTTNGTQRSLYKERVAYNDVVGEWSPVEMSVQIQSYIYHSDSGGKTYMSVEQNLTTTTLCRFAGGTRTVLDTIADTPEAAGYRVTVGLDDDDKEIHVVEKNAVGTTTWVPVASYTEPTPGALGTRGAGFQYGGLECRRGGFAVNSGKFDYFGLRDNVVLAEEAA
ncbi:hypothetical protein E4P29_25445 [Rhodococcus sp. 1R11]|uniref:hypothetical protein n=1 Tax=Rhodococcus sp. 1R11 TaxID=2559614 RepID=UPI001072B51F|nr:hypothetical protein [Rhodococcus sp. 1R11]TFI40259.1 hypothetical protein E4P29_25445 [Rhodococcus sp. 1R11]